MLHEVNEPIPSAHKAMAAAYRKQVGLAKDDGLSVQRAIRDAADEVRYLVDMGEVHAPDMIASLVNIGQKVDKEEKSYTDAIIRKLANGEVTLFDVDDTLSAVVTLGEGRRKSWRYVTAQDLNEMFELRRKNHQKQLEAFERFSDNVDVIMRAIAAHGTVELAVQAGAFNPAGEVSA